MQTQAHLGVQGVEGLQLLMVTGSGRAACGLVRTAAFACWAGFDGQGWQVQPQPRYIKLEPLVLNAPRAHTLVR